MSDTQEERALADVSVDAAVPENTTPVGDVLDDGPEAPEVAPATPTSRFVPGLVIGLAIGLVVALIVAAVVAASVVAPFAERLLLTSRSVSGEDALAAGGHVTPEQAIAPAADGTLTLRGWANGSGSSDGGMPPDFASDVSGSFGLSIPASVRGVQTMLEVTVDVTPLTKLTKDGKPWEPSGDKSKTPMQRMMAAEFGDNGPDNESDSMPLLERHQLVIKAHKSGSSLVADSVDINTQSPSAEDSGVF